jgi:DNA modification methylase
MASHKILQGDCIETLRTLPDCSVHCVVTSPPYWGLRDYGHDGQIGLEPTPEAYVTRIVEVFREVRRVLRDDGTLWLNLGDSYYAGGWECRRVNAVGNGSMPPEHRKSGIAKDINGLKVKDLVGIPWRVAFALQADGWWLRQDIIWHKPNPMPESVRDRCTKAHEYVFLLTKSERYFYDAEAVSEKSAAVTDVMKSGERRNRRSVWTVTTKPYKGAHFATMTPQLAELCILAGTSSDGCCSACGAPRERVVERQRTPTRPGADTKVTGDSMTDGNRDPKRHVTTTKTTGWKSTCDHSEGTPPCVVLDPFAGSGTTLAVAAELGRMGIGCELNPEYVALAEERIAKSKAKHPLLNGAVA